MTEISETTDYTLVSVNTNEHGGDIITVLEEKVRDHIKNGWKPFGNIVVFNMPMGQSYSQPMIKR